MLKAGLIASDNKTLPKLYVMCGISGCGKTTFAKRFAENRGLRYICSDDFYRAFNGDDRIHENKFQVWIAIYQAIRFAEENRLDCIIDSHNPTLCSRTQFLEWFPSFEPHLIYIIADSDLCITNNQARRRVIPKDDMDKIIEGFRPPLLDEDDRWASITFLHNKDNTGLRPVLIKHRDSIQTNGFPQGDSIFNLIP